MPGDKKLIRTIKLKNFLSFDDTGQELPLESLNVIIGPNASGKSNLIEAIGFLRATPRDLLEPIRDGGGVAEWLWKGSEWPPRAEIDVTVYYPDGFIPLRHRIVFSMTGQRFELLDEAVENEHPEASYQGDVRFFYRHQGGQPVLSVRQAVDEPAGTGHGRTERRLRREDLVDNQSVLSQRKDPDQYPEITYLGREYAKIKLYREWSFGRYTDPRQPQPADSPEDFLAENARNLGLVLNDLEHQPNGSMLLTEKLALFCESFERVSTRTHGGTVQVFVHEKNLNQAIPATRLSDGSLRFLCLLTILCHPTPPPLVCIEEPELGMHPDILPTIAELLVDCSHRTQLIVTTHSDILVDALTKTPEAVVVCEKHEGGTQMVRLDTAGLQEWLKKYTLGELWRKGEIGGNRW